MSRSGIIIPNKLSGRGMMVPDREGSFTFYRLPFISMIGSKNKLGNPLAKKIIIKSIKVLKKGKKERPQSVIDKLYPLKNYRKIKISKQFWKKNENPYFKKFNKKTEDEKSLLEQFDKYKIKGNNPFSEYYNGIDLNYCDIRNAKTKKLLSAPKTPLNNKYLNIKDNYTIPVDKSINSNINQEKAIDNKNTTIEQKDEKIYINKNTLGNDVKVSKDNICDNKNEIENNNLNNNIKSDELYNNKEKDEDKKEIKDPLLEDDDDLKDKEKIEDIINYLNGLDYDKYCKDMEIREALSLLKHKMDQEKEEKKLEEKDSNDNTEDKKEIDSELINEENNNNIILPEINKQIPKQNEIIDEEEIKRKEEIKKYKIAEQIAKSERMKKIHSVSSIKKLLQREGLDKINEQSSFINNNIKENPSSNFDEKLF